MNQFEKKWPLTYLKDIVNDGKQLLFHKCSADVSPTSKCSIPTLDLLYEKPLCRDHAMGKVKHCTVLICNVSGDDLT